MRRLLPALIGLILCALGGRVDAAVLFAGDEDIDFACNNGGSCGIQTQNTPYRSAWVRTAYGVAGSTSDPPGNRFATPIFSANSVLWVHAQYCNEYFGCGGYIGNSTTANAQMLRVFDNSGNPTLIVSGTGTAGQLVISSRSAAGTFTNLVTCSAAINVSLTQLDLYINYGTSGEVTLYSNSAQVCDFTGNVTNGDGATTLNDLEFANPFASGGFYSAWSEMIVATTDTRAMSLYTLAPNGNGNATQWTGSNPCTSILNALPANDTNYIYTSSNDQIEECTVTNSVPPGNYNVQALVMSGRLLVGASGPQHFDFVTRTGGTDYTSSDFAPTNSFSNFGNYIQSVNPSTSNPWALGDLIATDFNIGLESKP